MYDEFIIKTGLKEGGSKSSFTKITFMGEIYYDFWSFSLLIGPIYVPLTLYLVKLVLNKQTKVYPFSSSCSRFFLPPLNKD